MKKFFNILFITLSAALMLAGSIALGIHYPAYIRYSTDMSQHHVIGYERGTIDVKGTVGNLWLDIEWVTLSHKDQEVDVIIVMNQGGNYYAYRCQEQIEGLLSEDAISAILPKQIDFGETDLSLDPAMDCQFLLYFANEDIMLPSNQLLMLSYENVQELEDKTFMVSPSWGLAGSFSSNWTTAFGKIIMILWIVIGTGVVLTGLGITTYVLKNKQENKTLDK